MNATNTKRNENAVTKNQKNRKNEKKKMVTLLLDAALKTSGRMIPGASMKLSSESAKVAMQKV